MKTRWIIVGLVLINMVLVGLLLGRSDNDVFAQGTPFVRGQGNYIAVSARSVSGDDIVYIINEAEERVLIYQYETKRKATQLRDVRDLKSDLSKKKSF